MDPRDMLEINSINLINKFELQKCFRKIKTIIQNQNKMVGKWMVAKMTTSNIYKIAKKFGKLHIFKSSMSLTSYFVQKLQLFQYLLFYFPWYIGAYQHSAISTILTRYLNMKQFLLIMICTTLYSVKRPFKIHHSLYHKSADLYHVL